MTETVKDGASGQSEREFLVEQYPTTPGAGMRIGSAKGVKVTHKPTGLFATSESERSMHRNRDLALEKLKTLMAKETVPALAITRHPACKPDTLVNGGALKLALNVLRRAGKNDVADELEITAEPAVSRQENALPRDVVRGIFMKHGFTVKEGQGDLKEYVYDAAAALIRAFHEQVQIQPDCLACNDKGAVGNILTAEPCPDCTPTPQPAPTASLSVLFREALAWGMTYGPEIPAHQWGDMREAKVRHYNERAALTAQAISAEPAPRPVTAAEREAFEAWANKPGAPPLLGVYRSAAWNAWAARASHRQAPAQPAPTADSVQEDAALPGRYRGDCTLGGRCLGGCLSSEPCYHAARKQGGGE